MARRRPAFACPHCGETVASGARFCRACGADETTWTEGSIDAGQLQEAGYDADDDFDYDDYLRREFPDDAASPSSAERTRQIILLVAVAAVCAAMALSVLR
ncbi:MAG: zinc ribbon domain-containing protein [Pirellulales bacterium]